LVSGLLMYFTKFCSHSTQSNHLLSSFMQITDTFQPCWLARLSGTHCPKTLGSRVLCWQLAVKFYWKVNSQWHLSYWRKTKQNLYDRVSTMHTALNPTLQSSPQVYNYPTSCLQLWLCAVRSPWTVITWPPVTIICLEIWNLVLMVSAIQTVNDLRLQWKPGWKDRHHFHFNGINSFAEVPQMHELSGE